MCKPGPFAGIVSISYSDGRHFTSIVFFGSFDSIRQHSLFKHPSAVAGSEDAGSHVRLISGLPSHNTYKSSTTKCDA